MRSDPGDENDSCFLEKRGGSGEQPAMSNETLKLRCTHALFLTSSATHNNKDTHSQLLHLQLQNIQAGPKYLDADGTFVVLIVVLTVGINSKWLP